MTTSELDAIVSRVNPDFQLRPENSRTKHFGSYQQLKEFFTNESKFWSKFNLAPINEIRSAVNQILSALQNAEQVPGNQVEGKIRDAVQIARNGTIIYSDTAAAALIAKTAEDNQEVAAGVAAYFLQRISQDSSGRQVT